MLLFLLLYHRETPDGEHHRLVIERWSSLPTSLIGRINVFVYLFHNIKLPRPNYLFHKLKKLYFLQNSCMSACCDDVSWCVTVCHNETILIFTRVWNTFTINASQPSLVRQRLVFQHFILNRFPANDLSELKHKLLLNPKWLFFHRHPAFADRRCDIDALTFSLCS